MTAKAKKEILIAVLLVACLLLGTVTMLFVESNISDASTASGIRILITEICSSNSSIFYDEKGNTPDYIELYNGGEDTNLKDFGLANDEFNTVAYVFGDIQFPSGSYLLVPIDGIDVPFKLSSTEKEFISLISPDGKVADTVITLPASSNYVMLREGESFTLSTKASPGYPNTDEGVAAFLESIRGGEIQLSINEILTANQSVLADHEGDFNDLIEIKNLSSETVSTKGYFLSDSEADRMAYPLPETELAPGDILLIFASGKNTVSENGEYHADFKLSEGETVTLSLGNSFVFQKVVKCEPNFSQSLVDGEFVMLYATPGADNIENTDDEIKLVINEILTANQSVLPDFQGEFTDIIEIKNPTGNTVSTAGYYLSDSEDDRMAYPLPFRSLAPGEIMVIFASGKNTISGSGEYHANFRLSAEESVILSLGSKYASQKIEFCQGNLSQSLTEGENGYEYIVMYSTPGFENSESGYEDLENSRLCTDAPLVINELLLSSDETAYGGKLRDVIELCNVSDSEISTAGWFISDDPYDPYKFQIPEMTLAPNECAVFYAENSAHEKATGFALSSGESVYLTAPDYRKSKSVTCVSAGAGNSRSRVVENGEASYINGSITIGFANDEQGRKAYTAAVRPAEIEISEIIPLNKSYIAGPAQTYHDIIELHNRTDSAVELSGWYLSDDPQEPLQSSLEGVTIPANGYTVIILSSDGINTPSGYPVADFALSSSGESVCLSKGSDIVDTVTFPSLGADTAFGRANGEDGFTVLETPTPEYGNSKSAGEIALSPEASIPQGVYDEASVTVELRGEGNIYYTLDCTTPSSASTLYTQPLTLTSTTVIRCISVVHGKKTSEVTNLSYIINEPDTLEAVSVVTDPANLFDAYSGIYVSGPNAMSEYPYTGANYFNDWEREANISLFAADGGFSENCGVKIFGGMSRILPKKSLAFYFRSKYGCGELEYPLFADSDITTYETFILRNMGQDWKRAAMRDAMLTSLAKDHLGLDVQDCRPVVVYINGEYWGIYFIREKLNEHYVASHYNADPDTVVLTYGNGTRCAEYQELLSYAKSNDLSIQANYDHIGSIMDIENYIDYIAAEIIIGNTDNGNIKYFTYEGGKWRWLMYDVDHAFRTYDYNTVKTHLNPSGTGASNMFSTALINSLLKNSEFKDKFLKELAYQLEYVWNTENLTQYIDTFKGYIENDIARDCERWDNSYDYWESEVNFLYTCSQKREGYVVDYVQSYFNLTDEQMISYGFDI